MRLNKEDIKSLGFFVVPGVAPGSGLVMAAPQEPNNENGSVLKSKLVYVAELIRGSWLSTPFKDNGSLSLLEPWHSVNSSSVVPTLDAGPFPHRRAAQGEEGSASPQPFFKSTSIN